MSAPTAVQLNFSHILPQSRIETLQNLLQEAFQIQGEGKVDKKQIKYNEAFQLLQIMAREGNFPYETLYQVLYRYASETCYACRDEGFEESAKLMQISLSLQLAELNLIDSFYDWTMAANLNDLIKKEPIQFQTTPISTEVLLSKLSPAQKDILAKTVIRLAFSYQNIPALNVPNEANLKLHETLDVFAKTLIEDKLELAEYLYNRCSFLVSLKNPNDFQAKINAYDSVLDMFQSELPKNQDLIHQKRGQIYNMKAILTIKEQEVKKTPLEEAQNNALEYWEKGLQEYRSIKNMNENQEFLLHNLYSGYADLLVKRFPKNPEKLEIAVGFANSMESFMLRIIHQGIIHPYFASYVKAVANVRAAANRPLA